MTQEEYDRLRPKNAKPARAHGLPKIHKTFENIPKFRPIIDTTGTSHYLVGKFLTNLLSPLTTNEYTFKDTFDAVNKMQNIPTNLLKDGYRFVSFDVESLFTNVLLARTLNIITNRVFQDKLVNTNLKKNSLIKNLFVIPAPKLPSVAIMLSKNNVMELAWDHH